MSRKDYSSRTGKPGSLLQCYKYMVKLHYEFCITFIRLFLRGPLKLRSAIVKILQEVLKRRGIMLRLMHKRSQQGFPINKEQNCSIQNTIPVLQTLSQTSCVLSFSLLWHLEAREKKG